MKVQSVLPFIIFHADNGEEVTMEKCISTLKQYKKEQKTTIFSRVQLQNAINYYEKLIEEELNAK